VASITSGSVASSSFSPATSAASASKDRESERDRKHKSLTDHGQLCAATLLNMMMSVGQVPPTATAAATRTGVPTVPSEADVKPQNNAMDLDLGGPSGESAQPVPPVIEGGGFGRISSMSPSVSPTTASKRSLSMDLPEDQKEPMEPVQDA
jgi:hypothetical protein